jgi:hypothetical protein
MKTYQVFISSTALDLTGARTKLFLETLRMGLIPAGMETFSGADQPQHEVAKRAIEKSDYFCTVSAHRYGSRLPNGISYTETEYDHAIRTGIPCIRLLIDDKASWPRQFIDTNPADIRAMAQFKKKLLAKMCSFWTDEQDLTTCFVRALGKMMREHPRQGLQRPAPLAFATTGGAEQCTHHAAMDRSTATCSLQTQDTYRCEMIEHSKILWVIADDFHWLKRHEAAFQSRCKNPGLVTQLLIPHPRSPALPALARRSGKTPDQQRDEIDAILGLLADWRFDSSPGSEIQVYGHDGVSYGALISESVAVIANYCTDHLLKNRAIDPVPLLTHWNAGASQPHYARYSADFLRLRRAVEYRPGYRLI